MSQTDVKEQIVRQLDQLPPALQRKVLEFAEALSLSLPKGIPGKEFLRFAGVIGSDDVEAMSQAIEVACENVNTDELFAR